MCARACVARARRYHVCKGAAVAAVDIGAASGILTGHRGIGHDIAGVRCRRCKCNQALCRVLSAFLDRLGQILKIRIGHKWGFYLIFGIF